MSAVDSDPNLGRVRVMDTATVSDALDRFGIVGQCERIKPRSPSFRLAGRAFTILYGPAASPPGTVGDYIDDVPAGAVIMLDNGGREDTTVWGDILTEIAHGRELGGTVINGICRDVSLCLELGYPVYSRDHWMRTGKDRVQVVAQETPVSIGNVRVCPGDLILGDADGVVIVPSAHETAVLAAAEEMDRAENSVRNAVRSGMRLDEARKQFRYHQLQTRAT